MASGNVFNLQRYSIQDGPGIRTTVFLKGCPLRCAWCHNPESQHPGPEVVLVETRCVKCGECGKVCPAGSAGRTEGASHPASPAGAAKCIRCGACVAACPTEARQLVGRTMTVSEVLAEIRKDRIFFEDSGGGVTFSGGEPLLQPAFLLELLQSCRAEGIPAAVDTCGFAPREDLLAIAPHTDLFLYDLKFHDDALHQRYTGVSNATILDNLRALSAIARRIWLRVPIIPGVNDAPAELAALAAFAASVGGAIEQVNLLPYHETAAPKFARLGRAYGMTTIKRPDPAQMQAAETHFRAAGLRVITGG